MAEPQQGRKRPRSGTIFGQSAQKVRKLNNFEKKQVKRMISAKLEEKYIDTSQVYTQLDQLGTITALNPIARGTTQNNRIGDRTTHKYVDLRYNIYMTNGTFTAEQHQCRVIVFKYLEDDTAGAPVLGSILQFAGGVGDFRPTVSPYNWDAHKQKDFVILYDRLLSIGATDDGKAVRKRIKVHGTTDFSGAATTGVGKLYLLAVADDITGAHAPALQLQYVARCVYTDA